jgi:hypothetical protein
MISWELPKGMKGQEAGTDYVVPYVLNVYNSRSRNSKYLATFFE